MGGQPGRGPQLRLQGLALFIWASPSKIKLWPGHRCCGRVCVGGGGEHRCAASHPSSVIRAPGRAESRGSWLGSREEGCWRRGQEGCFAFTHLLRLCNGSGTELNELLCVNGRRGNAIERVGLRAADAEMLAAIHTLTTDDLS